MPLAPDRPSLRPFKRGDPVAANRFNDLQGAVITDITGGPGIKALRKGNSVSISAAVEQRPSRNTVALVRITGNAAGGGKYTGVIIAVPTTGAAATGDLSAAEIGTAGTTAIRIINTREKGKATHDLEATTGFLPIEFVGVYRGTGADGVDVYAIDGRQSEDCT